jgi:dTDP-4-amino-4,6-dideoxygalactose transaminase
MRPRAILARFEASFAAAVGARHAVATVSGVGALRLALEVAGVGPEDEVLLSDYARPSTIEAILRLRAHPVLVDVAPAGGTFDDEHAAGRVTGRTRALLPVHVGGLPCDLDAVVRLARRRELPVVEEATQALSIRWGVGPDGAAGDLTVFRLDGADVIAAAAGGMITTDDADDAERLRRRRARDGPSGTRERPGAAPGCGPVGPDGPASLGGGPGGPARDDLEHFGAIRAYYAGIYWHGLGDVPELRLPTAPAEAQHTPPVYVVQLDLRRLDVDRDAFIARLHAGRVEASRLFPPIHLHPSFRAAVRAQADDLPNAARLWKQAVVLPLYSGMSEADVWTVIDAVRRVVQATRRKRPLRVTARRGYVPSRCSSR